VAATEPGGAPAGALLAAALALPGVLATTAQAQTVPDTGYVQFKYLDYRDWQPGARRMKVEAPSLFVQKPLSDSLLVEGSLVYDAMSGASPLYFNALSGASGRGVTDYRTAGDFKVTKYFGRFAIGAGAAYSHERDYVSRGGALELRTWTPDKNRTFAFGLAGASDRIHTEDGAADRERKYVLDFLVGVTQAVSPTTIVQSNVTYSRGHGYFTDPYKLLDNRPDRRRLLAWLTRVNEHFPGVDGTLQVGYRYLDDSFGADSHMLEAAWVQALPGGWTLKPSLRYYTQKSAWFYYGPPIGSGFVPGQPYTADNRLSAYGAWMPGIAVAKELDDGWSIDVKVEYYEARPGWRFGGDGSPGILPFSARWIQVGVTKAL
jgi:hypothetical protein